MIETHFIFWALAGGVLPALLWLWFWIREDKRNPEPRKMIALTFLLGMVAVPLVLPFQFSIEFIFQWLEEARFLSPALAGMFMVLLAALSEEIFKFFAALPALRSIYMDEPIDGIIYLIVASLGFAGLENSLYILGTTLETNLLSEAALVGKLRFIGSSLLHIVSSAALGIFIAFSFYKKNKKKRLYIIWGLVVATVIHFIYNILVSREDLTFITAFLALWVMVIVLFIVFEKVKIWNKQEILIKED